MKYIPPFNNAGDPDASYVDADPANAIQGSFPVAAAFEHVQREIVNVIIEGGLSPDGGDLTQLHAAIEAIITSHTASFEAAPVGSVIMMPVDVTPTNYIKAQGQLLALPAYNTIHSVYGTAFGGDGVNTVGLPELRAEFPRFWDDGRGIDSGRLIGSAQLDQNKSHSHSLTLNSNAGSNWSTQRTGWGSDDVNTGSASATTSSNGGAEARPRNVSFLGLIKYQ